MTETPVIVCTDAKTLKAIGVGCATATGIFVFVLALSQWLSLTGTVHGPMTGFGRIVLGVTWVAVWLVYLVRLRGRHVTLRKDSIEIGRAFFPTRTVRHADIVARRTDVGPGVPHAPILILKNGAEVKLPGYLEKSETLSAWLQQFPYRQRRSLF